MQHVVISGHGGPDRLEPRKGPDPEPDTRALRIRVRASGINFADILARRGLYPDAPRPPCVVGYEVSDAVGADTPAEWVGKEVFALTRFGGYADTVVVPESR